MWQYIKAQPVRFFALIFLVAASVFLGYIAMRLVGMLESHEWCGRALQAERITPDNTFVGLVACIDILKLQVPILGTALHYVIGGFVVGMVSLIIIVVAKAKGSFQLPGGIGGNLAPAGEDAISNAVDRVAGAAETKADEIKADTKAETRFTPPPGETL